MSPPVANAPPPHPSGAQIALNGLDQYSGGGTFFPCLGRSLRPPEGHALSFRGDILHGGDPLIRGVRYIIACFCYHDGEVEGDSEGGGGGGGGENCGAEATLAGAGRAGCTKEKEKDDDRTGCGGRGNGKDDVGGGGSSSGGGVGRSGVSRGGRGGIEFRSDQKLTFSFGFGFG